jgi:hypothetical protein
LAQQIEYEELKSLVDTFASELDSSLYVKELRKILDERGKQLSAPRPMTLP